MQNNNKYHNGSHVYYYDRNGKIQPAEIYSIREYENTARIMRGDKMNQHFKIPLSKLWPTRQDCIDAKVDELIESATDKKDLANLTEKYTEWEGLSERLNEAVKEKLERYEAELDDGFTDAVNSLQVSDNNELSMPH